MIQVPNTLRMKVGSRFGGIDASAVAKAEAALKGLSAQFGQWLQDEIVKLEAPPAPRSRPTASPAQRATSSTCTPTT